MIRATISIVAIRTYAEPEIPLPRNGSVNQPKIPKDGLMIHSTILEVTSVKQILL